MSFQSQYIQNDISEDDDSIEHYGTLGMKWGVHRAERYRKASERSRSKAQEYSNRSKAAKASSNERAQTKYASKAKKFNAKSKENAKSYASIKKSILEKSGDKNAYELIKQSNKQNAKIAKAIAGGVGAIAVSALVGPIAGSVINNSIRTADQINLHGKELEEAQNAYDHMFWRDSTDDTHDYVYDKNGRRTTFTNYR